MPGTNSAMHWCSSARNDGNALDRIIASVVLLILAIALVFLELLLLGSLLISNPTHLLNYFDFPAPTRLSDMAVLLRSGF